MGLIRVLNDNLINKIAAGEVIERPASVVKELIENSIDAGSSRISIEIKKAGKKLIKISDNGKGMTPEDAKLSFQRHATSKIKDIKDLFYVKSLGFRGEALASIAAVSLLKLITKTKDSLSGTLIEVEGSHLNKIEKIGSNKGTTIEVHDLFYNTPARKKYLKLPSIEFSIISDIVTRYALRYPNINFKLVHDERLILSSPSTDSLLNNIAYIYGKDIAKNLVKINYKDNFVKIQGFISKPSLTRADKKHQSIFINGRYVKCKAITNAIYDAYHTMIMTKRHPIAVLMFDLNPKHLDVNVHPTKDIVRIDKEFKLQDIVFEVIKKTLLKEDLVPKAKISYNQAKKTLTNYGFSKDKQKTLEIKDSGIKKPIIRIKSKEEEQVIKESIFGDFEILGQIHKSYILLQNKEGLLIIDQHACEERINYENFMKQYMNDDIKIQKLVNPKLLNLTPTEKNVLVNNLKSFKKLGFQIEEFGPESFVLKTIPSMFEKSDGVVVDMIKELTTINKKLLLNKKEKKIMQRACKASIKAGKEMTNPEIRKLLEKLEKCEDPYHCEHGRPTIIKLTIAELERKFRRVV